LTYTEIFITSSRKARTCAGNRAILTFFGANIGSLCAATGFLNAQKTRIIRRRKYAIDCLYVKRRISSIAYRWLYSTTINNPISTMTFYITLTFAELVADHRILYLLHTYPHITTVSINANITSATLLTFAANPTFSNATCCRVAVYRTA